ncbi:ABC transporter permease subunit [Streptomyces sp. HC44]|uniref:ABC transporter permease subunit n=2 Tax=Streptomyces scabichelini TaxID=2711217 RepID=A0A6G4V9S2_9ACTN|nr:ABC transporter permease [Streptomyces scabichelini]NGO10721.1 ABC transporter permease subunit [Streptomyces scabichelini]
MMTTSSLSVAPASATPVRKVTPRGVLRSEWAKFWSLRSSWITLTASVVVLLVFGTIAASTYSPPTGADSGPSMSDGSSDAVNLALMGTPFVSLIVGSLGVLLFAGEYSTGMIRSTLAAVPRRLPVLFSKIAVVAPLVLVLTTIGAFVAFQLGAIGLDGEEIALSLGDDGVLRSLLGVGVYLALVAVFGVALGALLRSAAGGIASLLGILLILPNLTSLLPDSLADTLQPYFPSTAGEAMFSLHRSADSLSPGAGFAVFAAWVALALAAAAIRLKRTDA